MILLKVNEDNYKQAAREIVQLYIIIAEQAPLQIEMDSFKSQVLTGKHLLTPGAYNEPVFALGLAGAELTGKTFLPTLSADHSLERDAEEDNPLRGLRKRILDMQCLFIKDIDRGTLVKKESEPTYVATPIIFNPLRITQKRIYFTSPNKKHNRCYIMTTLQYETYFGGIL